MRMPVGIGITEALCVCAGERELLYLNVCFCVAEKCDGLDDNLTMGHVGWSDGTWRAPGWERLD